MPHPTNLREVRSFLGMVNQFSKFTLNLAKITKPIRELLVKNNKWGWEIQQQQAFEQVKVALISAPVLALYDPDRDQNCRRRILVQPWSSPSTTRRARLLETGLFHVQIDDRHRAKIFANRK